MESEYEKMYLCRRIVQAKLFIDRNFADHIAVDNIADEASFSKFHFIRLFRKTYGRTPHQYLTWVRIEKAKLLLRSGLPVVQVCNEVGFESPGSFATLFKKSVHQTPSRYRQHQKALQLDVRRTPLKYIPGCFAGKQGWKKNSNIGEVN